MPDPRLLLGNTVAHPGPAPKPVDEKILRGKISQINGGEIFAVLDPPYVSTIQVGPLESVTTLSVGETCLVAFDANRRGYIIYPSAASSGSTPSGTIHATAASAAPSGYLLCQGQEVSRITYATLFAAIGITYGEGNKSTTFNVPDGRNRSLIGSGTHALGVTGGEETVKLTEGQMPEHTHEDEGHTHETEGNSVVDSAPGAGTHKFGTAGENFVIAAITKAAKAKLKKAGKSEAHNNMPPYFVANWMIKI
jgi:microcystin-dependent protein